MDTPMLDNKDRYTDFSSNIVWHGLDFLKSTSESDRMFDSDASQVVDTYAAAMDNPSPTNMDKFNEACAAYRASQERGSNRAVICDFMKSHFPYLVTTRTE